MTTVLKKRASADKTDKAAPVVEKKRDAKAAEKTNDSDDAKLTGSGSINVMLAEKYDPEKHDPAGWLMSEKMDGVRCYWNGTTMYTRTGKILFAPESWKS
jgi:DNA ligase-1